MGENEGALVTQEVNSLPALTFNRDQIELIKRTVAKGTTDDELALFLYTAKRTGLDPLVRQIYAVKRWSAKDQRETMALQVGIDGLRLIAERSEKYAPGREPSYQENGGNLVSATAYVKKFAGGVWHEIGATAYFVEYVQKTKDGTPNTMWAKMPRVMLAKCAEALALRRAFPAETSGVYTHEEMGQAENHVPDAPVTEAVSNGHATPKPVEKATEAGVSVTFIPADVNEKSGTTKKGDPWTKYGIKAPDGRWFGTFDADMGALAKKAKAEGSEVEATYTNDGKYNTITSLVLVHDAAEVA